jgi:CubicO group peptidase (beta-lactamase class C family)
VPTPERAIYEIGSVTKQFTAAAILQLQEQGKLSLDDEITKYLPNYPVQGRRVTIRRLLDHTSGIKGYTELPEFAALMSRSLLRDSLVALFGVKPFDFAPGDAMVYNNSAYFLLGLVIEKVSGVSYAVYMRENLFKRAGMPDSRYCSNTDVVPRRAHGYDAAPGGLRLAQYIDFTWPYAAGSLCTTAGDLVAWTRALHGGAILGAAAYRELLSPGTLNDGTTLRYAKGLFVGDSVLGHRTIHHGGDIPGFSTELAYFPDDSLVVAVLVNTAGPVRPGTIASDIVRVTLGDRSPTAVAFRGRAADYVGEYRGVGRGTPLVIKVAADSTGALTIANGNAPAQRLTYLGKETFGRGSSRFTFVREQGQVKRLRADLLSVYTTAIRQTPAQPAADAKR